MHPKIQFTGDSTIPAVISLGRYSTPVWMQQNWKTGDYAQYIRKNGCGHCCAAMALNLHGISIDPHEEFSLCRNKWGAPQEGPPLEEGHFTSANGISEILKDFGVPAKAFGVPKSDAAAEHIVQKLTEGKQVIFWSHPSEKLQPNPFSLGEHYVMAVGFTEDGNIPIANSSFKATNRKGIQLTNQETIGLALFETCDPRAFTWGRYDLQHSGGYVVVG